MNPFSCKRHRFPTAVICQAVRLYFRFTLSIRDVEELMSERGIEVSRESIRCWVINFGPLIADGLAAAAHRQTLQHLGHQHEECDDQRREELADRRRCHDGDRHRQFHGHATLKDVLEGFPQDGPTAQQQTDDPD